MKLFKKLKMRLKNRRMLMNEIIRLANMEKLQVGRILNHLKKLDQEKFYICVIKDATPEMLYDAKFAFDKAANEMQWSSPQIFFINQPLETYTRKELEIIFKKSKV